VTQRRFSDFSRERFSDHGVHDCFRLAIAFPKPSQPHPQKERRFSLGTPEFGEGGTARIRKRPRSVSQVSRETKPGPGHPRPEKVTEMSLLSLQIR
jgi:hypothetical protein